MLITMGVVVIGDAAARHIYVLRNPGEESTGFLPPTAYIIIGMSLLIPDRCRAGLRQVLLGS